MFRVASIMSVIAAGVGLASPAHAQSTVYMPAVLELSGAGAVSGTNFRDGMLMAIDEINAKGGILGTQDRNAASRHAERRRHLARADAEGARQRALRDPRAGLLRLGDGRHDADPAGRDPGDRRRRSRGDHAEGQPLRLPHLLRPAVQHAEDRQLHPRRRQGEDRRGAVGEQRFRQGRPRQLHQGDEGARHQGGRRRLHRIRARPTSPPTWSSSRAPMPTRSSSIPTRKRARASCSEAKKQGIKAPLIGETTLLEPEGDRARRRRRQRRAAAMSASPPTRRFPAVQEFARQVQEALQLRAATTTASRATPPSMLIKYVTEKIGKFDSKALRPDRCMA